MNANIRMSNAFCVYVLPYVSYAIVISYKMVCVTKFLTESVCFCIEKCLCLCICLGNVSDWCVVCVMCT